jgi:hypothetical protein
MALLCNGFQFASSGVQYVGATALLSAYPYVQQGNFSQTGRIRNLTAGEGITSDKVGIPSGARHPIAWMMPQKAGSLSSHNNAQGSSTASATPVSLRGQIDGTCTVSGIVAANLLMAGTADGTSTATLVKAANGFLIGQSSGVATAAITSHAYGTLVGSISPFTTLSPENLAASVWTSVLAEYADTGNAAQGVLDAGAAGNPWSDSRALTVAKFLGLK